MMDKFKTNFLIVLPVAIITVILLFFIPTGHVGHIGAESYSWFKVLPYVAVLVFALIGFNVVAVIFGGLILTGIIGFASGALTLESYFKSITDGIAGMSDLIILSMLIGGMVGIMKQNGGIDFLLGFISKRIRSKKGAEAGIAGLVSVTNLATANNTIAIIAMGRLPKISLMNLKSTIESRQVS